MFFRVQFSEMRRRGSVAYSALLGLYLSVFLYGIDLEQGDYKSLTFLEGFKSQPRRV